MDVVPVPEIAVVIVVALTFLGARAVWGVIPIPWEALIRSSIH